MYKLILNQIKEALKNLNYDQNTIDKWHLLYYDTVDGKFQGNSLVYLEATLRLAGIKRGLESKVIVAATHLAIEEEFEAEQQSEIDFLTKSNSF